MQNDKLSEEERAEYEAKVQSLLQKHSVEDQQIAKNA